MYAELMKKVYKQWDLNELRARVLASQKNRALIYRALKQGAFPTWDFAPELGAKERDRYYSRQHILRLKRILNSS